MSKHHRMVTSRSDAFVPSLVDHQLNTYADDQPAGPITGTNYFAQANSVDAAEVYRTAVHAVTEAAVTIGSTMAKIGQAAQRANDAVAAQFVALSGDNPLAKSAARRVQALSWLNGGNVPAASDADLAYLVSVGLVATDVWGEWTLTDDGRALLSALGYTTTDDTEV